MPGTGPAGFIRATYVVTSGPPQGARSGPCVALVGNSAKLLQADDDTAAGVDYEIDIAQPEGSRIKNLSCQGVPVTDDQVFVVAVNNYRAIGGSGYPHISSAPIAHSSTDEIRRLMIDYVTSKGALDPADFADVNWRLTQAGTPVF